MIRKGDKVRILPEWQDSGDDQIEWFAVEDEDGGRVKVRADIGWGNLNPISVVSVDHIESATSAN